MLTHPFNPHAEQTTLSDAITRFRERWEQRRTMDAVFDLCDALDRAEEVSMELRQCNPEPQSELALVVINLQLLLGIARQDVAQVQDDTLEALGHRIAQEEQQLTVLSSPVLPAGTILSCPQCEEGLYKVTTRASVNDLVLDDGTLLQPLNTTIPKRDARKAFACPRCGGNLKRCGNASPGAYPLG